MSLTSKRVAKLLRQGEPGRHLDARGLYLVIASRTNAHWERRYQLDGREHYHGLGSAFVFGLAAARERSRRASELLTDGVNPIEQKRQQKAERIAAKARSATFGQVALDFYRAHSPSWGHPKHVAQWRGSVLGLTATGRPADSDYCKILRPLPVQSIDTPLILSVLKTHWHDKPETMSRVRARIASVLDYSKAAGFRSGDNPASWDVIGKLLPARSKLVPVEHYKAMDYRLVPQFVADLRKREGTAAAGLMFLIYSIGRTTEVLKSTWREINWGDALWEIPAERMKAERPHKVPLAPEALQLLRGLYSEDDNPDSYIFLSPRSGKPWSDTALRAVVKRMGYAVDPHGFRSSFSDWAHETTGYSNHAIEISLAHTVGGEAERAYRRGSMLMKRRRLMTDWAKYCTSPPVVQKAGETVVPMRGRA